jgi:ornithine cyclodeaminase/alanine dehydrogenase-like protein (mu-crystallin family)
MSREVLILREPEIRALLDPQGCISAMEQAFAAYSTGQAQLPGSSIWIFRRAMSPKSGARFTSKPGI